MDPRTVILILSLNLMAIGGLLAMIGRRMDESQGMRGFAAGSMVFGLAYLARLALGHQSTGPLAVVPDTAMIYATLCYATGLRQFGGQAPLGRRFVGACTAAFGAVSLLGTLVWQDVGRHAVLNGGLAVNYLVLSVLAAQDKRRVSGTLQVPLTVLAVVTGLLGLLTAMRCVAVLTLGVGPLFTGLAAQLYYGYSTVVTVVLGPNLLWMVFMRLNDRLAQLATHDPLTGLLNRNGLDEALQRHFAARPAARAGAVPGGHRPLQAHQRQPRPRRRRHGAQGRGADAGRRRARRRPRRPAGRRGVPGRHQRRRPVTGAGPGRTLACGGGAAGARLARSTRGPRVELHHQHRRVECLPPARRMGGGPA